MLQVIDGFLERHMLVTRFPDTQVDLVPSALHIVPSDRVSPHYY